MRILLVTNMFPSPDEPWYGSFVKDQAEDLVELGAKMHVLSFDGRKRRQEYGRAALAVRRLVARSKFDLVHAHYGLAGAVALAQRHAPVVTTFHGSDTGYVRWQRSVSWLVARRSTPLFVSREGAIRLGLPDARVIPMGVDVESFAPTERRQARRTLRWNQHASYVLLPGARANRVKSARLFDAALDEARKRIPKLRAVSLEGYSRDLVPVVLNAVDVVLMTSEFEGSPLAVREALACLTPVVSVPVGDVPLLITGLSGCAVVRRDPQLLGQAVLKALDAPRDPGLRERAMTFSRPRVAERVLALYGDVVPGACR